MKLWSRLCFLVLAISSISRGQNETLGPAHEEDHSEKKDLTTASPPPLLPDETKNEAALPTRSSPSPQSHTSPAATDLPFTAAANLSQSEEESIDEDYFIDTDNTTEEVNGTASQTTASASVPGSRTKATNVDVTTVSTTTASTSPEPAANKDRDHSSWGYVFLVFIILVIIILCVILYFLRRVSRTYSFDLHRPAPVSRFNEPIGTFEPVYLDDLDRPAPKDQVITGDVSPPPVANGTTLQSEEKGSNGDNGSLSPAPQEQPDANGLETSPTSNTSLSSGDDPADKISSPLSSTDLFFDATGKEQQNENNNNPSVCSSDPFVEINLDEPVWCDQLLNSPEAPSSVLPFSPFSFSSSSSSSS